MSEKGFSFSVDAALSVILFVTLITVVVSVAGHKDTQPLLEASELSNDVFSSLEKSGFLLDSVDTNTSAGALGEIYSKARGFLHSGYDFRLSLSQFDLNESECRSGGVFAECFEERYSSQTGAAMPANKSVFHGKRVFVKRQPTSECTLGEGGLAKTWRDFYTDPLSLQTGDENFEDLIIFDVNTSPSGQISCDQNVLVTLSVTIPSEVRRPIDLMLVIDRSGSMSWSGNSNTSAASALWLDTNTVNVAYLGGATLWAIDITNPLIPVAMDARDPGTVNDVYGRDKNVFVTDTSGTDQLFSYNTNNPANFSLISSLNFDAVYGLFAKDRNVFVAGDYTGGGNSRGLYIFNTTNPANMTMTGRLNLTNAADVFVKGTTAYVARLATGLSTVNIANPANPALISTINPGGTSEGVFVDGDYAYVATGGQGLAVINVANPANMSVTDTISFPGSSNYSHNVYKQGNEAFVADDVNLVIADVNDPANISISRAYATSYNYTDVWVRGDYAYLASALGLTTVDIYDGPKINNTKVSAKNFVDFNGWQLPPDQMGLATFNTSATLNQQLSADKNAVKSSIDALVAQGGTHIESGITAGTDELLSPRASPTSLKFMVLLSDGRSNDGNSAEAAITAAQNGIKIYTIGFGADAAADELTEIARLTDGNYYSAEDENALSDVFEIISRQIAEVAQDANISASIASGENVVNPGSGIIDGSTIVFDANNLDAGVPWINTYTVRFPCNLIDNCGLDAVTFPGAGTTFNYVDSNGVVHFVGFNASTTLDFLDRDLSVNITGGRIISDTEVLIDVNVSNTGDLNTGPATLKLRMNALDGTVLDSEPVPGLCGENDTVCTHYFSEYYQNLNVGQTGIIYAVVNDDNSVSECPANNYDSISCLLAPRTQYYELEYWVWKK